MQEIEIKLRRLYRQRQSLANLIRAVEEYALVMGTDGHSESVMAMVHPMLGSTGRKPNSSAGPMLKLDRDARRGRGVA